MTVHERDAALDFIGSVVFATGHRIPDTSMGEAKHHDAGIGLQHLATASGLVTLANEISVCHCLNSLSDDDQIAPAPDGTQEWQSAAHRVLYEAVRGKADVSLSGVGRFRNRVGGGSCSNEGARLCPEPCAR
ncbi:hypothetical protein D9M71_751410 [compost metagenome]